MSADRAEGKSVIVLWITLYLGVEWAREWSLLLKALAAGVIVYSMIVTLIWLRDKGEA